MRNACKVQQGEHVNTWQGHSDTEIIQSNIRDISRIRAGAMFTVYSGSSKISWRIHYYKPNKTKLCMDSESVLQQNKLILPQTFESVFFVTQRLGWSQMMVLRSYTCSFTQSQVNAEVSIKLSIPVQRMGFHGSTPSAELCHSDSFTSKGLAPSLLFAQTFLNTLESDGWAALRKTSSAERALSSKKQINLPFTRANTCTFLGVRCLALIFGFQNTVKRICRVNIYSCLFWPMCWCDPSSHPTPKSITTKVGQTSVAFDLPAGAVWDYFHSE